jgi:YesN/AraC family two-component response regulator
MQTGQQTNKMVDNKKKVLLVDDEPFLLEALAEYLMEFDHEIYTVLTANNGREALEFLPRKDIGLIVSDIYMPEISGIQLLIRIKEKYPETGVILMSAYCSEQIRKEVDQNGCLHFIEKPFEFAQIRKLILENIANP